MAEWDETAIAIERERRAQLEANGICPDSGYTIKRCWDSDLCDCAYSPPPRCDQCPLVVWDLKDHVHRMHPVDEQPTTLRGMQ